MTNQIKTKAERLDRVMTINLTDVYSVALGRLFDNTEQYAKAFLQHHGECPAQDDMGEDNVTIFNSCFQFKLVNDDLIEVYSKAGVV